MNLSISQMQNVLRTYQTQVREEKVKAILGAREESSGTQDRVDISREGRSKLEGKSQKEPETGNEPTRR
ncbi:MAG TPA: hypothetical protein VGK27_07795 [Candidatus Deferrimicrobiaceae bacterium]|jgi:hypothetical protein